MNKNKTDIYSNSMGSGKIDNQITNLLNSIKVIKSFRISYFIPKARLVFTWLKKRFTTKTLVPYYFDAKYHI